MEIDFQLHLPSVFIWSFKVVCFKDYKMMLPCFLRFPNENNFLVG